MKALVYEGPRDVAVSGRRAQPHRPGQGPALLENPAGQAGYLAVRRLAVLAGCAIDRLGLPPANRHSRRAGMGRRAWRQRPTGTPGGPAAGPDCRPGSDDGPRSSAGPGSAPDASAGSGAGDGPGSAPDPSAGSGAGDGRGSGPDPWLRSGSDACPRSGAGDWPLSGPNDCPRSGSIDNSRSGSGCESGSGWGSGCGSGSGLPRMIDTPGRWQRRRRPGRAGGRGAVAAFPRRTRATRRAGRAACRRRNRPGWR